MPPFSPRPTAKGMSQLTDDSKMRHLSVRPMSCQLHSPSTRVGGRKVLASATGLGGGGAGALGGERIDDFFGVGGVDADSAHELRVGDSDLRRECKESRFVTRRPSPLTGQRTSGTDIHTLAIPTKRTHLQRGSVALDHFTSGRAAVVDAEDAVVVLAHQHLGEGAAGPALVDEGPLEREEL